MTLTTSLTRCPAHPDAHLVTINDEPLPESPIHDVPTTFYHRLHEILKRHAGPDCLNPSCCGAFHIFPEHIEEWERREGDEKHPYGWREIAPFLLWVDFTQSLGTIGTVIQLVVQRAISESDFVALLQTLTTLHEAPEDHP